MQVLNVGRIKLILVTQLSLPTAKFSHTNISGHTVICTYFSNYLQPATYINIINQQQIVSTFS